MSSGVFFDVEPARLQLATLEAKTSDPNFWQDQAKAQATLQQRKVVEDRLTADKALQRCVRDIETYIGMAQEEADDAQRNSLLEDADKELIATDTYLSELQTQVFMSGITDHLNAII